MNHCITCRYVDSKMSVGTFMYEGSSYCQRHLILAMQPKAKPKTAPKVTSDASKVPKKVKWSDDK